MGVVVKLNAVGSASADMKKNVKLATKVRLGDFLAAQRLARARPPALARPLTSATRVPRPASTQIVSLEPDGAHLSVT